MSGKPKDRAASRFAPPFEPGRQWATRAARELFRRIVAEWPAGHFREGDRSTLEIFVLATLEAREHETALANEGYVLKRRDGTCYPNPRALLRDRAWVRIRDSGAKLRLHLSSRMRSESANTAAKQPGTGLPRPWESFYFDDASGGRRHLPDAAQVARKYGL